MKTMKASLCSELLNQPAHFVEWAYKRAHSNTK